ncbi:hypothetical protein LTS10_007278 [Elasticomyces elasticus]|nr:hypothetical protein LTS10_007278 [Elasticomyces elasticus]
MARRPAYVYQPLNNEEQEIRLLLLGSGEYDDPLQAGLVTVSIRRPHSYHTISYVWGDPRRDSNIYISGTRLAVPTNTALALRRVRLQRETHVVWIDAVCINQHDVNERSKQVGLMGMIYHRSSGNLVHLTDDHSMARRIVQMTQQVDEEARAETNNYTGMRTLLYTATWERRRSLRPTRKDLDIEALQFLLRLPWFR